MPKFRQTWDNSNFFSGSDDPRIAEVVSELKQDIADLGDRCAPFATLIEHPESIDDTNLSDIVGDIRTIHQQRIRLIEQLGNLRVFMSSVLSVDSQDADASKWLPTLQQIAAEKSQAQKPLDVFLLRADKSVIEAILADPALAELSFSINYERRLSDQLLSVQEEKMVAGLSVTGLHSWGNLYDELAGTLKCEVEGESIGLAKAANLLSESQREKREAAWRGVQAAWSSRQETAATLLNSINGWRLEETKQRAKVRELHYLDKSCHQNSIERSTLDTLMETTYEHRSIGQRAIKAMGQLLHVNQMAPWDLMAPAPIVGQGDRISFDEAIELIADAFSKLTPAMGDFTRMMAEKGWIDGEPTPSRRTGAYCTSFQQPREPRIFITFEGTMTNVMTLAHELGHAWHNWVMRDLSLMESYYPMTLAETASIFAETLVRDALLAKVTNPIQQLEITWQDAQSASSFIVNIPARFEFERKLVEARKQGFVIADDLKKLMAESWQIWYEDSLSEYDQMFWASKLHFSISQIGFYNYPYLFGYLFSLGIYAQQETYGDRFNQLYTDILRDTGRMTAEDLVKHHLQQDISNPEFWQASLNIVDESIKQFEQLANEMTMKQVA
ncbi:MAG: M3 family oligoendopeptidase [Cyanobacteria bacterium P01_F01_bin.150]